MTAANSSELVFLSLRGLRKFWQTFMLSLAFFTATGCGGGSTSTTPSPPPPPSEFVYLAEFNTAIHSYKLDTSTGELTEVGTPTPSIWARPLVTEPKGRFLYTAPVKTNIDGVWAYSISSSTGQLLQVPGSPYTNVPLTSKGMLAVEPSGKFLYYNQLVFSIDQSSGALTELQNVTVPSAFYAITKDDLLIGYSCSGTNTTVSSYRIGLATGEFTALENFDLVLPCSSVVGPYVDPSGRFIYIGGGIIQLDPTTGAMSQIGSTTTYAFVFDPSVHFVYGGDYSGNLYGFAMDPNTGALSPLPGFPIQFPGGDTEFGIDSSGKFLITMSGATYQIDQTSGSLTPTAGQVLTGSTAVGFYPPGSTNF